MKKASILAFQFADNFGAVLQIYALQKVLEDKGVETEVINFRPYKLEEPYSLNINFKKTLERDGFLKTVYKSLYKKFTYNKRYKTRKAFDSFRDSYLNITKKSLYSSEDIINELPTYDYYFVGSDQVWNPALFRYAGLTYFLDFVPEKGKKISYAASIAQEIDQQYEHIFQEELPKFHNISVREESAQGDLIRLTGLDIKTTLDPTLLLKKDEWLKLTNEVHNENINEPFILVYDLQASETIINLANDISKRTGFSIVCYQNNTGYENVAHTFSNKGPDSFLNLINNAEYVITSSFHGTAFSVIFEKEFFTVPHSTRGSRMIDFLTALGLENQLIADSNYDIDLARTINYKNPLEILDGLITDSLTFIDDSMFED